MKSALGFVILVILVLGALFLLPRRKWPPMPNDAAHCASITVADCRQCHAPGKVAPLKSSHPPKLHCFKCHKMKKG